MEKIIIFCNNPGLPELSKLRDSLKASGKILDVQPMESLLNAKEEEHLFDIPNSTQSLTVQVKHGIVISCSKRFWVGKEFNLMKEHFKKYLVY